VAGGPSESECWVGSASESTQCDREALDAEWDNATSKMDLGFGTRDVVR